MSWPQPPADGGCGQLSFGSTRPPQRDCIKLNVSTVEAKILWQNRGTLDPPYPRVALPTSAASPACSAQARKRARAQALRPLPSPAFRPRVCSPSPARALLPYPVRQVSYFCNKFWQAHLDLSCLWFKIWFRSSPFTRSPQRYSIRVVLPAPLQLNSSGFGARSHAIARPRTPCELRPSRA